MPGNWRDPCFTAVLRFADAQRKPTHRKWEFVTSFSYSDNAPRYGMEMRNPVRQDYDTHVRGLSLATRPASIRCRNYRRSPGGING